MNIKEESLKKALKVARISELPRPLKITEARTWLNAIVLVKKAYIESYCIAMNNGDGTPVFTYDFGPCMIISSIVDIYPISFIDSKFVPDFRSDKAIIEYLVNNGHDGNVISRMLDKTAHATPEDAKRDRERVKVLVNQAAIKYAKKEYDERQRCETIKKYKRKKDEEEKQGRHKRENKRS